MTPEAQRIAIAEACGWTINTVPPLAGMGWPPNIPDRFRTYDNAQMLPFYTADLNAMHDVEKLLDEKLVNRYIMELSKVTMRLNFKKQPHRIAGFQCHASAAMRAEAFLRTIGKWID